MEETPPVLRPHSAPATPAPTPPPEPTDWRDAPITPGDWHWSAANGRSTASFAGGRLELQCNLATRALTMFVRSGNARANAVMTVSTTSGTHALPAQPQAGGFAAALPAGSPAADAMAFSRGRFAVTLAGEQTLYIPSWTEVSRAIEDCR